MFFDVLLLTIPLALHWQYWPLLVVVLWWVLDVIFEVRYVRSLTDRRGKEYIYFFTDKGQPFPLVKIGRASDVTSRLRAHRTGAPFGIKVFLIIRVHNSVKVEAELHHRYAHMRLRKNFEWFFLPLWLRLTLFLSRLGRNEGEAEQTR